MWGQENHFQKAARARGWGRRLHFAVRVLLLLPGDGHASLDIWQASLRWSVPLHTIQTFAAGKVMGN
eukprot:1149064-Pelagomonas_calceolata.AAC.6